jgi:type II secretory pathway pseudopilin PulG
MRQVTTRRSNAGFTYLTLMLAIVVMGAVLGAAAEVWHTSVQREKERELLFVGNQFRVAIGLYYVSHAKYPRNLEDLIKDPLSPSTRRYLRKIYRDPVGGTNEWAVVRMGDGGIVGVHSLSEKKPIKVAGFGVTGNSFDGAVKYSDWVFAYRPRPTTTAPKPNFGANGDKPLW